MIFFWRSEYINFDNGELMYVPSLGSCYFLPFLSKVLSFVYFRVFEALLAPEEVGCTLNALVVEGT